MTLNDLSNELRKILQGAGNAIGQTFQPQIQGARVVSNIAQQAPVRIAQAMPQIQQTIRQAPQNLWNTSSQVFQGSQMNFGAPTPQVPKIPFLNQTGYEVGQTLAGLGFAPELQMAGGLARGLPTIPRVATNIATEIPRIAGPWGQGATAMGKFAEKNAIAQGVKPERAQALGTIVPLMVGGLRVAERQPFSYPQKTINLVKQGFDQGVREKVGQFAQLVEQGKPVPRQLKDYVYQLGETVFGKNAQFVNTRQLKNAFDTVMQQADSGAGPLTGNVGLAIKNLRGEMPKGVGGGGITNAQGILKQNGFVANIGQLNKEEVRWLDKMVKEGKLIKGKGDWTSGRMGNEPGVISPFGQKTVWKVNPNYVSIPPPLNQGGIKATVPLELAYKEAALYPNANNYFAIANRKYGLSQEQAIEVWNKARAAHPEYANLSFEEKIPLGVEVDNAINKLKSPNPAPLNQGVNSSQAIGTVLKGETGKLPQQVETATTRIKPPEQLGQVPGVSGGGSQIPPSEPNIDPVQKIINALQGAKPIRGAQEAVYTKIRSQQAGALVGIGGQMKGEAGFYQKLGQLKGEMPKVSFESIKSQFQQPELDALYNKIEAANLSPFEKVTAQVGLKKLLGAEGGTIPNNSELQLLNQIFPKEFTQAILDKRPFMQKLFANVTDALNIPRAIMATADMSAPLRQGAFLIGRPKQWLPAFREQFKYFFSPKAYEGLQANIQARPTYQLMRDSKLAITDMGPMLNQHEESFMSNIIDKIPGIGAVTQASQRSYSGFLNKLRADTFDSLVSSAKSQGLDANAIAPDIARFVNSATGRGELPGALQRASVVLNGLMFSPRLLASRINLMNPVYYASLNPFVRKEALKSLATFAGTAMTVLGLAKLSGADVGADPRSADFGKIKFGNTRYDILAGFQQPMRVMAQLVSGKIISTTTGREITLGEGYKPMTRGDIVMNFLQSKESPVVGLAMGLLQGQNSIGQPFNVGPEVIQRFIPMVIQDMYDLAKDKGSPLAALAGIPGIFGVGVQTYGGQVPSFQTTPTGKGTIKLNPMGGLAEDIVAKITGTPQSNIPKDQWAGIVNAKNQETQNMVALDKIKQQLQLGQTPTTNSQQATFNIKGTDFNGYVVGKNFVYQDVNGDIQSPNLDTVKKGQISYQKSIDDAQYSLTADQLKRDDNSSGWIDLTNNYIQTLTKYASKLDPKADKSEILGIQNKVADLMDQIKNYQSYGGFKKAKKVKITIPKPSKAQFKISLPKMQTVKLKKPPKITKNRKYTIKIK